MKGFKVFFLLILLIATTLPAQQKGAELSLVSVFPGDAIYSTFGHIAFRYVDKENGIDNIFPKRGQVQTGVQELHPSGEPQRGGAEAEPDSQGDSPDLCIPHRECPAREPLL